MIIKVFHLPNNNWAAIKEEVEFSADAKYLRDHYAVYKVSDYAFAILSRRPEIDTIIEKAGGIFANDLMIKNLKEDGYPYIHRNATLLLTL